MPSKKYSKEKIIEILKNLYTQIGKTNLTKYDVSKVLSLSTVNRFFGNLGNALDAAGISKTNQIDHLKELHQKQTVPDSDLFVTILFVEIILGHEPGYNEYSANGNFSYIP